MNRNVDEWLRLIESDLTKSTRAWADEISKALNGGNTGELDTVVERIRANTLEPTTNEDNATSQVARLLKWRVRLLKFGMLTSSLLQLIQSITEALDTLSLQLVDQKFAEVVEIDYLADHDNRSMAADRFDPHRPDDDREHRPRFR